MEWICSGPGCGPGWFDWVSGVAGLIGLAIAVVQASRARGAAATAAEALNKASRHVLNSQLVLLGRDLGAVQRELHTALKSRNVEMIISAASRIIHVSADALGAAAHGAGATDAETLVTNFSNTMVMGQGLQAEVMNHGLSQDARELIGRLNRALPDIVGLLAKISSTERNSLEGITE